MSLISAEVRRRQMLDIVAGELAPMPSNPVRNTRKYTNAQTNERDQFIRMLVELGKTLPESNQTNGRPRLLLPDVIFAIVYRSYRGVSTRRFMCDLRDAYQNGSISKPISFNAISQYLRDASLTPVLTSLIEGTAASFAHIETSFAVDSTGFPVPNISKWYDAKYGWRTRREWVKCHTMVGVKSHIIVACEVTRRAIMDQSRFKSLLATASEQFAIDEVAADAIYSTSSNLEYAESLGAAPAIPFKLNSNPFRHSVDSAWRRLYHLFALNSADYQERLNKQNQAESTFSMIKRRFGEKMFSKDDVGQTNEVLCKILAHNLCVILYWLHQFGVNLPDADSSPVPESTYPRCNAMAKAVSMDAPLGNSDLILGEIIADKQPDALEQTLENEGVCAVVDRLVVEQGLSREGAWKIVEKLL